MNFADFYYVNLPGILFGWIGDVLSTLNQVFYNMVETLLGLLEGLITKTPYPKESDGTPQFLGEPSGEMWLEMYNLYQTTLDLTLIILMILLVVVAGVRIFDAYLPTFATGNQAGQIVKMMFASYLWWPIGVGMLMLSDVLAQAVLTLSSGEGASGEVTGLKAVFQNIKNNDAMGFSGETANGVEGVVMSLAMLIPFVLEAGLMVILVFAWIIRYIFIYLFMPLMPLLFALMAFNMPGADDLQSFAKKTAETYVSLVFLSFPAAVIVIVFGRMSGDIIEMVDSVIAGNTASATMTLADGAAATGDVAGIVSSVTTIIIGICLMAALPLIAAGGPFVLITGGNTDLRDAALTAGTGGLAGGALSAGRSASSFAGELMESETGTGSSEGETSEGGDRETETSESGGQGGTDGDEQTEETSSSRFGRMKQKMSSSIQSASNLKQRAKDWDEKSMAQKTKDIGSATVSAGSAATSAGSMATDLMKEKSKGVKSEVGQMRELGVSDYYSTKSQNAKNKAANSLSQAKVSAGDGMESLKESVGDVGNAAEKNLKRNRGRLTAAREGISNVREEGVRSTVSSKVSDAFHTADWDEMSEAEKKQKLMEVGMLEEYQKDYNTSSAKELYQEGMIEERRTANDIHEDRLDETKDERDQKKQELEEYMKALGVWEEYQANPDMKATDLIEREIANNDSVKASDLPPSVAGEVGLNASDAEDASNLGGAMGQHTESRKRKQTVDEFFESDESEFDSREELMNAIQNGEEIHGKRYGESEVPSDPEEVDRIVREDLSLGDVEEETTTTNRDSGLNYESIEEYRDAKSGEELMTAAKHNGYTNEDGEVTEDEVNQFLKEVIAPKAEENAEQSSSMAKGDVKDQMGVLLDDAEKTESVGTEAVADLIADTEHELEQAEKRLGREGGKLDEDTLRQHGMSDEDIDALEDDRPEDVSEDGRKKFKEGVMPDAPDREFTDAPESDDEVDEKISEDRVEAYREHHSDDKRSSAISEVLD